jgi:predicted O-methyltransferase YrrM
MADTWINVDQYFGDLLAVSDPELQAALAANSWAGLPSIDVSPLQGRFLELLVRISGAKRVLEIGTLGGYSTIWLARAVGETGHVVTLEANPVHADVARSNLAAAGLADRIDLKVGLAIDTLPKLLQPGSAPFDLIFIDADKRSNPEYLTWALRLSRPGTVIIVDNVVRDGKVLDADSPDPDIQGIRRFAVLLAQEPRLTATVIQTVGAKGYDGFVLAVVKG